MKAKNYLPPTPQERHVSTDAPDWKSLGDLLVTRRVQLHPQYKNRRKFVADTTSGGSESSWYRLITSIETGNRDNYSRETYAAMEVAYQLKPGSLTRTLRTSVLEPLESAEPDTAETAVRDERLVIENIRATAQAQAKTIGEVLVERGLATPAELTVSEDKRFDEIVNDILGSNLPDETKDIILMDYVKERRQRHQVREAQRSAAISKQNREAL